MISARTDFDVFLSHSASDAAIADVVDRRLNDAGLRVFSAHGLKAGTTWPDAIRDALAESSAVVVLLTPASLRSSNLAVELGAALAWNKPIYPLLQDLKPEEVPVFLRQFQAVPLSRLDEVVKAIVGERRSLTDDDADKLIALYQQHNVSVDELIARPAELSSLARAFGRATGTSYSPEEVMQLLIRRRKQGDWPRLGQRGRSRPADKKSRSDSSN